MSHAEIPEKGKEKPGKKVIPGSSIELEALILPMNL